MAELLKVPFLGVNDSECKISSWEVPENNFISKGTLVCVLETTKTTFDVESPIDGYLYYNAAVGDTLQVNDVIGLLTDAIQDNPNQLLHSLKNQRNSSPIQNDAGITKKAEILINSLHVSKDEIERKFPGQKITEALVHAYVEADAVNANRRGFSQMEKVAIIGGVSGGGALIVIDSIEKNNSQRAVCVFDQAKQYHGKSVLGVPVVGDMSELQNWIDRGQVDTVVIAFNRNLGERERVFEDLQQKKVKFTNVIDPTVELRSGVSIGMGNVILARAYIGACSQIGDNNFISANVCLEHGNILGSHCAFGPGVFTSGNVTIGNTVRFGTGVFIEPNIDIGKNAIISSGSIIVNHVQPGEVVGNRKVNK